MPKIVDWDAKCAEILSATWRVIACDGLVRVLIRVAQVLIRAVQTGQCRAVAMPGSPCPGSPCRSSSASSYARVPAPQYAGPAVGITVIRQPSCASRCSSSAR